MQALRPVLREHDEIHVFCIRHPFKLDRQLIQIPNLHHRFIRPRPYGMLSIVRELDLDGRLGKGKVLDELELSQGVLST